MKKSRKLFNKHKTIFTDRVCKYMSVVDCNTGNFYRRPKTHPKLKLMNKNSKNANENIAIVTFYVVVVYTNVPNGFGLEAMMYSSKFEKDIHPRFNV